MCSAYQLEHFCFYFNSKGNAGSRMSGLPNSSEENLGLERPGTDGVRRHHVILLWALMAGIFAAVMRSTPADNDGKLKDDKELQDGPNSVLGFSNPRVGPEDRRPSSDGSSFRRRPSGTALLPADAKAGGRPEHLRDSDPGGQELHAVYSA